MKAAAGVQIAVGRATITSGTGVQTIASGLSFQPKAYILLIASSTADNTDSLHSMLGAGMTDGTRQFCMGSGEEDNQASSDVGRRGVINAVLCTHNVISGSEELTGVAVHSSFASDGFSINKTTAFVPTDNFVNYIAFGGDDLTVYASTTDLADTVDTSFDVSTIGFEPDVVITTYNGSFDNVNGDADQDDNSFSLGWAVNPDRQASNNQFSMMTASQDAQAQPNSTSRFDSVRAGTSFRDTAIDASYEINTFDASGFTVTTRLAAAVANEWMGYLALNLGSSPEVYTVARTARTLTGDDVESGASFQPVFLLGVGSATSTSANSNFMGGSLTIGMTDGTNTHSIGYYSQDIPTGTTNSNTATRMTNTRFMRTHLHTGGVDWDSTFSSFASNGWTLNYGDAALAAYQNAFLAIGASIPAASAPTVTTNTATGVGVASAILNGEITATGGSNSTVRGFAWGTNSTLSSASATTTESGDFGTGTFSQNVSGLLAGITYYFRAYATNPNGTGYGTILNFTAGTDTTVRRKLRLFEGFTVKLISGKIILHQQ